MMHYKYRWLWMFLLAVLLIPQTGFARNVSYYQLNIDMSGDGNGIVRGPDIKCVDDCSRQYPSGKWVTLIAKPAKGSKFAGWDGCNRSIKRMCMVKMSGAKSVTATFNQVVVIEPPSLTVSLNALTAPALIGSTGIVLADVKLLNNSAEDVKVSSIAFTYAGPLYAIQNAKLYNGGNGAQIGPTISTIGESITFYSLDVTIPGNSSMSLIMRADISLLATVGDMITLSIGSASDIIATGIASGYDASIIGTPISATTVIASSILQVFIASGSPSIISGGQSVEMMRLGFFVESWGEYVLIDSITISFNGIAPENLTNIRLVTPSQIGDTVPILDNNGKATFQNLNWTMPPGSVHEVRVRADFFPNTWGIITVGINQPSDISAIGLTTATTTLIGGNFPLIWNIMY